MKNEARRPLTRKEAGEALNSIIKREMAEKGGTYIEALARLQREKPAVIAGYQSVIRRSM